MQEPLLRRQGPQVGLVAQHCQRPVAVPRHPAIAPTWRPDTPRTLQEEVQPLEANRLFFHLAALADPMTTPDAIAAREKNHKEERTTARHMHTRGIGFS
jgi:hypothetical protein